jgi:hypothetical protein
VNVRDNISRGTPGYKRVPVFKKMFSLCLNEMRVFGSRTLLESTYLSENLEISILWVC